MAAAGAEGGSIGSMSDTNIALSPSDAAIIMYNTSNSKWEDNQCLWYRSYCFTIRRRNILKVKYGNTNSN